jgi:hypothetical protein
MIDKQALLDAIAREVRPRLSVRFYDDNEYGEGYNCCGCETYSQIVEDIEALIERYDQP